MWPRLNVCPTLNHTTGNGHIYNSEKSCDELYDESRISMQQNLQEKLKMALFCDIWMIRGQYALSYCGTVVRTDELYSHYAALRRVVMWFMPLSIRVCYYVRNTELASAAYVVVNYERGRDAHKGSASWILFRELHIILLSICKSFTKWYYGE